MKKVNVPHNSVNGIRNFVTFTIFIEIRTLTYLEKKNYITLDYFFSPLLSAMPDESWSTFSSIFFWVEYNLLPYKTKITRLFHMALNSLKIEPRLRANMSLRWKYQVPIIYFQPNYSKVIELIITETVICTFSLFPQIITKTPRNIKNQSLRVQFFTRNYSWSWWPEQYFW